MVATNGEKPAAYSGVGSDEESKPISLPAYITSNISKRLQSHWQRDLATCQAREKKYIKQLEEVQDKERFKYLLLLNINNCEKFTAEAQIQAQQSFRMGRNYARAGFVLIVCAVALGIYSEMMGGPQLQLAYLTGIAGVIMEFISGVILFIYSKTIQQTHEFHSQLQIAQRVVISVLLNGAVGDGKIKDSITGEMVKLLLGNLSNLPQAMQESPKV